jgi:reverse transcriptase-like protein
MPGIPREVMCHKLDIKPGYKPVKQKLRHQGKERIEAAKAVVQKLLNAHFIRECQYSDWLSNVVLVKKPNGKWRMCVEFTDLNKACPKDDYSLPKIDRLVDSTAGHSLLSFMDANAGYHQIPLAEEDQPHTDFITNSGVYCYRVMPFGLKNAGATYKRMVNKVFYDLIGRNLEVYVDI